MHSHGRLSCLTRLCAAAALCAVPGLALASSGRQYVALRRERHCDSSLTYAAVQAVPSMYVGRVLEIHGTVGGRAASADGMSIMLNLVGGNTGVTLDVPTAETALLREYTTPNIRVLVRIGEGSSGNVVPLVVLAMAHDSEVSAFERQYAERQAAVRRRLARYETLRRDSGSYSRGGYFRVMPASGSVRILEDYYLPRLGPRAKPLFHAYFSYILSRNARLTLPLAGQITYGLLNVADRYNVDPRLVVAMIIAESDFNPNSTSRTGAMGLGQLMPGTARALGVGNAYDPVQNLEGSIAYLSGHLNAFAGSFDQVGLAMAAYNAGPNAVKKYGGIPPYRETQAYVRRVTSLYRELCGQ